MKTAILTAISIRLMNGMFREGLSSLRGIINSFKAAMASTGQSKKAQCDLDKNSSSMA
jgi:hypothetical protein